MTLFTCIGWGWSGHSVLTGLLMTGCPSAAPAEAST